MNANCRKTPEQIERYLDDELSSRGRQRVEQHLQGCFTCRRRLKALQIQAEFLRQEVSQAADQVDFAAFEEQVLARVAKEPPTAFHERALVWLREVLHQYRAVWITSLATALLLIGILLPILSREPSPEAAAPEIARAAIVDNEVIIDSMEYSGERSMIFTVSKNNTTVIWLYDIDRFGKKKSQGDDL